MNVLRSLIPAPLQPAARRAKRALRSLRSVWLDAPLATDCRASLSVLKPVLLTEAGKPFPVHLKIVNHSPRVLSSEGTYPVGLEVRWSSYAGAACRAPNVFLPLPQAIWPGEELDHVFTLNAPESLGDYVADFALVQKGGPRFEQIGHRAKLDVPVTTSFASEFNYHDIYANADLNRDFWSASGPPSQAEFERLMPIKLKLLTDQGLTADGKILDVGCGTGLLAAAAERFLTDRGLFFGTDLAKEAVEFCKSKYTRPNFHFAVNGMTTIPVQDIRFDAITYFSVFTHTYVEETALLLAESKRVLAPKGFIFADCFTSPLVERSLGSRYAVEVNRDLLLRLAGVAGLKAELIMDSPWKGEARREFYKFTHQAP